MTLTEDVLMGMIDDHPTLSDPEMRMNVSQRLKGVFDPKDDDARNMKRLRDTAKSILANSPADNSEATSDSAVIGEVYAVNWLRLKSGKVIEAQATYVSFPDWAMLPSIEKYLLREAESEKPGEMWTPLTLNVSFDDLTADDEVTFFGSEIGEIVLKGKRTVGQIMMGLPSTDD